MTPPQNTMLDFLNERISTCNSQQALLQSKNRDDEATFEKVKANIYDIFRTIYWTASKASGGSERVAALFFQQKLQQIPANWEEALLVATQHDDAKKAHVEKTKLEAVQEIKTVFYRQWGELQ